MLKRIALLSLLGAAASVAVDVPESRLRMFKPLPAAVENPKNPITPEKVELGRMLYYENRLSKSHKFSCNSCHKLDQYGVDNEPTSEGHRGQRGDRNSPTVYNAAVHFVQFWDGRAADVEEQAKGPVLNPVEMAMPDEKTVIATLKSIPQYVEMFRKAFPQDKDPVNYDNMAKAIGAFERKLMTPSRWDRFLQGDKSALNDAEKAGFLKFVETGCTTCHMGACVGGTMYQKLGVAKPYPGLKDEGRAKVTGRAEDKFFFKVPGLRNVEKTWPYFHDGSVKSLEEAVRLMAEYELGRNLSAADAASIVTWLKTLTGEIPQDYVKPPALPPSTAKTPKPSLTD
ncbi:MAG: cytochrome-c peroxidase [Bryobacteraceae bacterium]|nr:MAG: cytochrome-c peroxidase [Bryobacteraceae bacterium]